MRNLSTKQLAAKAGVTVRTLHYYDQIGLLKPNLRSEKGYRQYSFQDQLVLQQILFFKELGLSLKDIREKLTNPNFNLQQSLQTQHKSIEEKITTYQKLLNTLDITIKNFNPNNMSHDLYEGFPEESKKHREEAAMRWPEKFQESQNKLKKMSPQQRKLLIKEGKDIAQNLGKNLNQNLAFDSSKTQNLIKDYHDHMNHFYKCTPEIYKGLGEMYVSDPRFTKYYEDITPGLANYVNQAIQYYVTKL